MKGLLATTLCVALAAATAVPVKKVSYDGYKVVRVNTGNHVDKVAEIIDSLGLTTWKGAPKANSHSDIVVPPSKVAAFDAAVADLSSTVMHEDLGASIAAESDFQIYAAGSVNATWFNSYHAYADHIQFVKDLQAAYPANSEVVVTGNSLNGKAITGIRIFGSSGKGVNPAVVVHGTVHAREWITTMATEYLAYQLLSTYATSTEIKGYVDKYDIIVIPIVNPDGFLYTQTNERLWRKNRQTTSGSSCLGHDINRNWPYKWDVTGGASTNPCADDFKGLAAGDAPETKVLSAQLNSIKSAQGLKMFIDVHSYSQLFMTPYGYSCTAVAPKASELNSLAAGAAAAIKAVNGLTFKSGPICTTIYQATGSSVDYVNDVVGADYTFTTELRDTGTYGFVLPASQIVPASAETFAGIKYLLKNMK